MIQGPRFERNNFLQHCQRWKTWWEHGASFQSSPKINRMLITRLISIPWKFTTLTIKVLLILKILLFFFRPLKCLLVRKQSTFICGPTRSGKAPHLIFPKVSSQNMWSHNDSYSQFPQSPLGPQPSLCVQMYQSNWSFNNINDRRKAETPSVVEQNLYKYSK